MSIEPIKNYLLLKEVKKEENIQFTSRPIMENKAEVISVGPDVKYVKAGDFVLFEDFNRINVELSDSSKGWMLSEDHILAIIKE